MGNSCTTSSQMITKCRRRVISPAVGVAIVVKLDGKPQEFRQPVRAGDILSENPNCFLCSSEAMDVDSPPVTHVAGDEELQLGQLYFLLPISQSRSPLSLHDLCALAVKASAALGDYCEVVGVGEGRRRGGVKAAPAGALEMFMVTKKLASNLSPARGNCACQIRSLSNNSASNFYN